MRWRALRPTWAKKANARSASRRAGCNRYGGHPALYAAILALQCAFYLAALTGWALERSGHRNRLLFIPYYFLFMNLNVFRGASYLATHRGKGAWEKARRA